MTAVAALMSFQRPALAQSPTGGSVVTGTASISQAGSVTNINQSSQKAIINWQGFSVGAQNTVNFNQPNSSAATLNRVIGNETSVINGAINANGQVFIVNSNGVLFGKGSQVNVGGLVASTLDISNSDFMARNYTFSGTSNASVINQGRIRAHGGGYVALLGKTVSNEGVISARLGTVAMSAGEKITLNFEGNSLLDVTIDKGTLNALVANKRAIRADGGQVIMTAKAADQLLSAQVNNSGIVQARTVAALKGGSTGGTVKIGKIKLLADGGTVNVFGKLDASAPKGGDGGAINVAATGGATTVSGKLTTAAEKGVGGTVVVTGATVDLTTTAAVDASGMTGGTILVGGDRHGGSDASENFLSTPVAHAMVTTIARGATLTADGRNGSGGNVVVWSDGQTDYAGSISATGAGSAGNGGFAEVSSHGLLNFTGPVDLSSAQGAAGTLLLDPYNVTISAAADSNGGFDGGTPTDTYAATGTSFINTATLLSALANANVVISTAGAGTDAGTITVGSALDWSSSTHSLTLSATNNININAPLTWSGSALTLQAGGNITSNASGILTQIGTGGSLVLNAATGITFGAALNLGNASLAATTTTGAIAINAPVTWSGTSVQFTATAGAITATTLTQTGNGSLALNALNSITFNGVVNLGNASLTAKTNTTATIGNININQALNWSGSAVTLTTSGGTITNAATTGILTQTGNGSLTLNAGTGSITFMGALNLGNASLDATSTTGNINIRQELKWSGSALTFTANGGNITNNNSGILTQIGNGSLALTAKGITFTGALNLGNASLTAAATTGNIAISAPVTWSGTSVKFEAQAGSITTAALTQTGTGGSLTLKAATAAGIPAITLNGALALGNASLDATATTGNISINAPVTWSGTSVQFTASAGSITTATAATLTQTGSGSLALKAVTGSITVNGAASLDNATPTLTAARDITINAPLSWSGGTLTLSAANNIYVNGDLTGTGSTVGFNATSGTGVNVDGTAMGLHMGLGLAGYYKVYLPDTATVSLNGVTYSVITNQAQLDAVSGNLSGHYMLGSDIANLSLSDFQPFGLTTTNQFIGAFSGFGHSLSFVPGSVATSSAFALSGLNDATIVLPFNGTIDVGGSLAASSAGGLVVATATGDINITSPLTVSSPAFRLSAGGNITVTASSLNLPDGTVLELNAANNVNINNVLAWSSGTLALNAGSNIFVNAAMTATGTARLVATYGSGTNADGAPNGIYMAMGQTNGVNNGTFVGKLNFSNTAQGALNLGGHVYTVVDTLDALAAATAGGFYALGSDLNHATTDTTSTYTLSGSVANVSLAGLDGLGHTVTGVTINDTTANHGTNGLVQQLAAGGIIRNVGVVNITINAGAGTDGALVGQNNGGSIVNAFASGGSITASGSNVGGLVGGSYGGLVANSWANVDVTGRGDVGGLIGYNGNSASVLNSYAQGAVNANPNGTSARSNFGGLVGTNSASTIKNSYATGDVLSPSRTNGTTINNSWEGNSDLFNVGGLVGNNAGFSGVASTISYSWASGKVTSAGNNLGGLVGQNVDGRIDHSYATGIVTSTTLGANNIGGLVGLNSFFSAALGGKITNSYATGDVFAPNSDNVGGIVGKNDGSIKDSQYIGGTVTGREAVGGVAGYNTGSPAAGGGLDHANASGTIIGIKRVGGVVGTNSTGNAVNYATVKDSTFLSGSVSGDREVGGIAGYNAGKLDGSSSGIGTTVTGNTDVGGIAGYNAASQSNQVGGIVNNSHSSATVIGNDDATTGSDFGHNNNMDPNTVNNSNGTGSVSTPTSRAQAAAVAAAQVAAVRQAAARTGSTIATTGADVSSSAAPPATAAAISAMQTTAKLEEVGEGIKQVERKVKDDDRRRERERKAASARANRGSGGGGAGYGATIRSINVDGQRFDLENNNAPGNNSGAPAPDSGAR